MITGRFYISDWHECPDCGYQGDRDDFNNGSLLEGAYQQCPECDSRGNPFRPSVPEGCLQVDKGEYLEGEEHE